MSYKEYRCELAVKIMAGFAANPAVFAPNSQCGWALVNSTNEELAAYAVQLAGILIACNEALMPPDSASKLPAESTLCAVCDQIRELHPNTHPWTAKSNREAKP